MAERISHDVTPPKIGPGAHEELERLLQTLHEHGVLRLANDLVAANTKIAGVVVDGLSKEGTLNALQNLSILAMMLSQVPPERFYRVTFALKDALDCVGQHQPHTQEKEAPGVGGPIACSTTRRCGVASCRWSKGSRPLPRGSTGRSTSR